MTAIEGDYVIAARGPAEAADGTVAQHRLQARDDRLASGHGNLIANLGY